MSRCRPDLPTISESGVPGHEYVLWYGVFAPAKTPPKTIGAMSTALASALRDTEIEARLITQGAVPKHAGPAEFARFVEKDRARLQKVIRAAGIKPD